jgi:hypothetical protein
MVMSGRQTDDTLTMAWTNTITARGGRRRACYSRGSVSEDDLPTSAWSVVESLRGFRSIDFIFRDLAPRVVSVQRIWNA